MESERRGCTVGRWLEMATRSRRRGCQRMEMKRSVVGVESTRGDGNCFLRQILVHHACPRSVRTALQSRFGTSSGAEISFLGRDPTSPASGPLARLPPLERSSATSSRLCWYTPLSRREKRTVRTKRLSPTTQTLSQIDPRPHQQTLEG